jgi:anthranilate/para-aminobenzoate synthase component I
MKLEPTAEAFAGRYVQRRAQVVWTTLIADLETPASIFLKIAGDRPMSFLLESVEAGAVPARYSIIGLEPDLIFRGHGACAEINRTVRSNPDAFALCFVLPRDAGQINTDLWCGCARLTGAAAAETASEPAMSPVGNRIQRDRPFLAKPV